MTILEAIQARHSVRSYFDKPLADNLVEELNKEVEDCNRAGNLHIQLVTNEPNAFGSMMAHYGKFSGVKNYFAMIGKKSADLEERLGYYGEHLVLKSQTLGLNTCWVALTFSKGKCGAEISESEKLVCVIALGYGTTQGVQHRSKPINALYNIDSEMPEWFKKGVEAAALAPTAMNQQKFKFVLKGDSVQVKTGMGFYTKLDLGIVKYHFEMAAGKDSFRWG